MPASHALDPRWQQRREEIADMPRDVLEARLITAEMNVERLKIDVEFATVQGQDLQRQLDAERRRNARVLSL